MILCQYCGRIERDAVSRCSQSYVVQEVVQEVVAGEGSKYLQS